MRAGIVDYRMGNLASVSKAMQKAGAEVVVSDDSTELAACDMVVLPGVGAFAAGMRHLQSLGLCDFLLDWGASDKPLLGICLGMQLLFDESEEGHSSGLGLIPGKVVKLNAGLKVPHMGWNSIDSRGGSCLFDSFDGRSFYFVHSYVCEPALPTVGATTQYGGTFVSALEFQKIYGVQFHPEKSSTDGLQFLSALITEVEK